MKKKQKMVDMEINLSRKSREIAIGYALDTFLTEQGRERLVNIPKLVRDGDNGFDAGLISMAIAQACIETVEREKARRLLEKVRKTKRKKG